MADKTVSYLPGEPAWIDLGSPDVDAAAHFYAGVFGWSHAPVGEPEAAGGYGMLTLGGKEIAGIGPLQPAQPPSWTTYICVDDADKAMDLVQANAGSVIAAPMDVMNAGRMAVFADPTGAVLALWQPRMHRGAEIVREPNTFAWAELNTRDLERARTFYRAVFGWDAQDDDNGYVEFQIGGRSLAGAMAMPPHVPPQVTAYWLPYFQVDDADATAARVVDLGGQMLARPMTVEVGRFAVVTDPHGAAFGIIRYTE